MWTYLIELPPLLSFSLIIVAVVGLIIIAIKGKVIAKWGKNAVGIGASPDSPEKKESSNKKEKVKQIPKDPGSRTRIFVERKRSCSDCIEIVLNKKDKFDYNKMIRKDKILTYRMNYTEEKLLEIETSLIESFEKRISEIHSKERYLKVIETKMFYGLLKESLFKVKKEIRKSYKENGFFELNDVDFLTYVEDKTNALESILTRHLRNIYPNMGTLINIDTIISDIESKKDLLHECIGNLFSYAKQVVKDHEKESKNLKKEFNKWLEDFIE